MFEPRTLDELGGLPLPLWERVGVRGAWKKRPPLNPSPGRHRFAMLSSGSRPLPPQVGFARLAHYGAEPGQARVRWERWTKHVAPLSLSNTFGSCIRHF